jgi:hypothetical protein
MKRKLAGILVVSLAVAILGCTDPASDPVKDSTALTFSGLTANGTSGSVTTTALTLTFSADPTTLAATDITVTGATRGALSGTGTTRTLAISAITVADGANVTVALANPAGYTITPAFLNTAVFVSAAPPTAVTFSGLTSNGTSGSVTTTALTLTFSVDPTTLAATDITVTGATKGALSGTGTTRTLAISAITVANGANVTVALANPAGFTISPASRTVAVYVVTAPAAPAGLSAGTVVSAKDYTGAYTFLIPLSWGDYSVNENDFLLEVQIGAIWATAQYYDNHSSTIPMNTTSYTVDIYSSSTTGICPYAEMTTYSFRLSAENAAGSSGYATASAITGLYPPVLSSSVSWSFQLNGSTKEPVLQWTDNSSAETSYRISRATGSGGYGILATVGANVTTYTDTSVVSGNTYSYLVNAYNSSGSGVFSTPSAPQSWVP